MPPFPNKPDAVNPAMASGLNSKHHWRGVTDPERWLRQSMRYRKTFSRLFLIAFAVQLVVYALLMQFGTDRATSGITWFGHACLMFYYPVFAVMLLLPQSIIGTGLGAFG